jgi:hypothetical protein
MQELIWRELNQHTQRILSQIDRDPDSPTYGCFDRNFWNYKIRDFSSAIQQQAILVLDVLYSFEDQDNPYLHSPVIKNLISAGVNFWTRCQLRTGSFNEYYPWESGFPPTAFGLYSVAVTVRKYPELATTAVLDAINQAASWLLRHPEREALNQESAALAGMVIASRIQSAEIDQQKLAKRLQQFYDLQNPEGWFNEYGGPDLGYLSVTIDSLWDIWLYARDDRALAAANKACDFISLFVTVSGEFPIMINARNTDYLVPYGITGLASESESARQVAMAILKNMQSQHSMFSKTDDRYMTHYIGHSYFRSLKHIGRTFMPETETQAIRYMEQYLPASRIYLKHTGERSIFVALGKGGIVNEYSREGIVRVNYGWRLRAGMKVAVTHWQNNDYSCNFENSGGKTVLKVEGSFSEHGYLRPSPARHVALRLMALLFGNRLIGKLKSVLIFNQKKFPVTFSRTIAIDGDSAVIEDQFSGQTDEQRLYPAPSYSLRHVSSAGRFVIEELHVPEQSSSPRVSLPRGSHD